MKTTAGKAFEFKLFCSKCQIVRRLHPSIGFSYGLRARICGDCQVVEKTAVSISHYVANDRN